APDLGLAPDFGPVAAARSISESDNSNGDVVGNLTFDFGLTFFCGCFRAASCWRISSSRLISSVNSSSPSPESLGDPGRLSNRVSLSEAEGGGAAPRGTSSEPAPTILTSLSLSMGTRRTPLSGGWGATRESFLEALPGPEASPDGFLGV